MQALVISRLDYANAVLVGLPENTLRNLIAFSPKGSCDTDIKTTSLVARTMRIVHKVLCLVYKAMTFAAALIYIKDMLELYSDALEIVLSPLPYLPYGTSCHPLLKETRHS